MPKNSIRSYREKRGLTQTTLAERTKLSLRTIQRVESGKIVPKGHTLTQLAEAFNMEPAQLQHKLQPVDNQAKNDKAIIKWINLSALAFFGIPFGNLIFPIVIWYKNKDSAQVNEMGKKIINFQVFWSLCLYLSLIISPYVLFVLDRSFPLILIVFFMAVVINVFMIAKTAISIEKEEPQFLNFSLRLL